MIWLTRSIDKQWLSFRDDCRNDDGGGGGGGRGVESILMAKKWSFCPGTVHVCMKVVRNTEILDTGCLE